MAKDANDMTTYCQSHLIQWLIRLPDAYEQLRMAKENAGT